MQAPVMQKWGRDLRRRLRHREAARLDVLFERKYVALQELAVMRKMLDKLLLTLAASPRADAVALAADVQLVLGCWPNGGHGSGQHAARVSRVVQLRRV